MIKRVFLMMAILLPFMVFSQDTLVKWTFPNNPDDSIADGGIAANLNQTISCFGTSAMNFNYSGYTTNSARTTGWDNGANTKYWQIAMNTTGYIAIKLSSRQVSSNTGPKNFSVQFKIGSAGTWTDIGSALVVTASWTGAYLNNIGLPAACENQDSVFVRWLMTTNTSVSGGTVASGGTNRIDDIIVLGSLQGSDVTPPTVLNAFATSLSTVKVVFSEAVNATAEVVGNYTGLTSVLSAVRNTTLDTVTLTLGTPLTSGANYTLTISNVQDTSGNTMTPPQNFPISFTTITYPQVITAYATSLTNVIVKFNKPVNTTAENVANYTGLGTLASAVRSVTFDTVNLTINPPLTFGTAYTLTISNVQDTSGNAMSAPQQFPIQFGNVNNQNIVITEIMYNPPELGTDTLEFIELYNTGNTAVAMNGFSFSSGFVHNFHQDTIKAHDYYLLAVDSVIFFNFYGVKAHKWTSGSLSNSGEAITLIDNYGLQVDSVYYKTSSPWPVAANGNGSSLMLCDPSTDNNVATNWVASGSTNATAYGIVNSIQVYATPGAGCICNLPAPIAGNNGPVCEGSSLSLTASTIPGATYSWTGPNGFTSTSQNPIVSSSTTTAMAGTYNVTATVGVCTSPAGATTVVVNSIPSAPVAGNNGPVNIGSALSLTASTISGATYNWTGPNGFTSSSQNPVVSSSATLAMAGTYNVTATANGCTSSAASTTVIVIQQSACFDDFNDGDFTNNPTWTGDTNKFIVDTTAYHHLQLNDLGVASTSYLSTANITMDSVWTFWAEIKYNTSSSNYSRVYLVSDSSNLKGALHGYYVQLGSTIDNISLYKQNGTTLTNIINGTVLNTGHSDNVFTIKVTRDCAGRWSLYSDSLAGTNFTLEGDTVENTFTTTSYFGVYCKYTSTTGKDYLFDDFCLQKDTCSNCNVQAPVAGNNGPVCEGSSLSLTASTIPGATYNWTGPNGFTSTSQNPIVSSSATTAMAGTYNVTATVGVCTSPAGATTVVVNSIPSTPVAGNNGPVNIGSTLSLTASTISGSTYNWTGPNGFSSSSQNPVVSSSATLAMAGTYNVTATANGCTSSAASTIVIVIQQSACFDDFNDGDFTNNPTWTGDTNKFIVDTTVYHHLQLNDLGVASTSYLSTTNITMDSVWTFWAEIKYNTSSSNYSRVYLVSDSFNLKGALHGYYVQLGSTIDNISLYKQNGTTLTNIINGTVLNTGHSDNVFTIKVTRDCAGKWSLYSDSLAGTNFTLEGDTVENTFTTTSYFGVYCKYTSTTGKDYLFDDFCLQKDTCSNCNVQAPVAGNNGPVCEGSSLSLTASTIPGATYNWTGPNGFTSTSQNPIVSSSATTAMAGTYNVTATVGVCTSPAGATTVVVNSIPSTPVAGNNGPVNIGSTLSLTASTISGSTYNWTGPNGFSSSSQNPVVSSSATLAMAGTYNVTATANGCTSSAASTIVIVIQQSACFDDFNDGDFTNNPTWTGDTNKFIVDTTVYHHLQLNDLGVASTSYLSTTNITMDSVWTFWAEIKYNTSSSNYSRVYLVSDSSNLKGALHGYYVQLGSTNDNISLYKQNGTTLTNIINGTFLNTGHSDNVFTIKVTRDCAGKWSLYSDSLAGTNFTLEGDTVENTFTTTSYFGVYCKYSSTTGKDYLFDDFCLQEDSCVVNPGIKEYSSFSDLIIAPNPTQGIVNIYCSNKEIEITLFDMLGRIVKSIPEQGSNSVSMDLADVPQGIYFIQVLNTVNHSLATRKIVKY